MSTTIRQVVTVGADGVVEVRSPQLREGDRAEVTIVTMGAPDAVTKSPRRWQRFAGAANSANRCAGDNPAIDADLAAEAGPAENKL